MALNFAVYVPKTLVSLGTLLSLAGEGGSLRFTPKSWNGTGQLCVIITKADGTSATATCSKTVTNAIRTAKVTKVVALRSILHLEVLEGTEGGNFISAPSNFAGVEESFKISELVAEPIDHEELVAF